MVAVRPADAVLRLALAPGLGPVTFHRLLEVCGSAELALAAGLEEIEERLGKRAARALARVPGPGEAARVREEAAAAGQRVLTLADDAYPRLLREIPDAPPVLWVRGALPSPDRAAVAIVGSRRASTYGLSVARRMACGLAARGILVVSGLAMGIDGAAHRGALDGEGETVGVLGAGLDRGVVRRNRQLADDMLEGRGAFVSEYPPGTEARPGHFPRRNRIISGWTRGVVVCQAARRSGSLITARWALDQGREVMAVPGRVDRAQSRGTHGLLRDGAALVTGAADVCEVLGLDRARPAGEEAASEEGAPSPTPRDPVARKVLELLSTGPRPAGELIAGVGSSPPEALRAVSRLERSHRVRRRPDGTYELA